MKRNLLFVVLLLFVFGAGCTSGVQGDDADKSEHASNTSIAEVDENGYTNIDQQKLAIQLVFARQSAVSDNERESLLYMREEEKLAHDVFMYHADAWDFRVFENIASSELTHTNAVKSLLDELGIRDIVQDTDPGVFKHEELQRLYNDLIAQGLESQAEALKVGAVVEEVDILDLEEYLKETKNESIILVYENLMRGSRNHLRAFVWNLERQGVTYAPSYLSEEAYRDIIGSEVERTGGNGYGGSK